MTWTAILRGRQTVIIRSRIALRPTCFLVDERLNAGKLGRGERGPACAVEEYVDGLQIAGSSSLAGVRHAQNDGMAPEAVRGKQRNIREIALAIGGYAIDVG